jgi:hypothetical protein
MKSPVKAKGRASRGMREAKGCQSCCDAEDNPDTAGARRDLPGAPRNFESALSSTANPKFATYFLPSFPRKRESSGFENEWISARARFAVLAGMTIVYATN